MLLVFSSLLQLTGFTRDSDKLISPTFKTVCMRLLTKNSSMSALTRLWESLCLLMTVISHISTSSTRVNLSSTISAQNCLLLLCWVEVEHSTVHIAWTSRVTLMQSPLFTLTRSNLRSNFLCSSITLTPNCRSYRSSRRTDKRWRILVTSSTGLKPATKPYSILSTSKLCFTSLRILTKKCREAHSNKSVALYHLRV